MGRPKGSKNQPKPEPVVFKPRSPFVNALSIPRECLKLIHDRARGSGLTPQMVLEDLIWAGNYTMGETYDNFTNYRRRMREKSINRTNVNPILDSTRGEIQSQHENVVTTPEEQNGFAGVEAVQNGSHNATERPGRRGEDNPAFRDPGELGNVINAGTFVQYAQDGLPDNVPDLGPVLTDEVGNPIEPQEAQEEFEELE